ncbi:membrane-spanning 4-domains subfamily A member 4A-like [Mixophyes fleayi]|uniref:membrane-spanning 4-domains subfamily A member 4A-like n=1 Tax=Mixophyes fleayi TaxID=3061075 RepID=UPI003F4DD313
MSSSQSQLGGFVTISQGANVPQEAQSNNASTTVPKALAKFFQGEPEPLGVTQIVIGITQIVLGIVLTVTCKYGFCMSLAVVVYSGVPFWSGVMYVISGSLSVAASYKPTIGKVTSNLVLNTISSVVAAIAVIMFCIFFPNMPYSHHYRNELCAYYKPSQECAGEFESLILVEGIVTLLFILTVLELTIALSTSIFGCKTTCRTSYNEVSVVVYHTTSMNVPDASAAPIAALSSDGELKIQ